MNQKYALVTGTDHGLGLALVKNLLNRKYYVVAARLTPDETQIDDLCKEYPEQMAIVTANVGDDKSVQNMKEEVSRLVPHLDLVINDAGILGDMQKELGDELDFDEMLRVINVNSLGPLRVTNALLELLLKGEDKTVLNITSEAGSITDSYRKGWFGYCMSKAANNMQSTLVHNCLYAKGCRVIAMHPGHVATYMRGHLDTTATLTPDASAEGILHVVLDTELPREEKAIYIDYSGEPLPW